MSIKGRPLTHKEMRSMEKAKRRRIVSVGGNTRGTVILQLADKSVVPLSREEVKMLMAVSDEGLAHPSQN